MSEELRKILDANKAYAAGFRESAKPAIAPRRRLAILTCMDARLDPAKFTGLADGDAHVIRNAGGRASDDAIRSLVISYKLLGTREWLVIHHNQCGMATFTNEVMRQLLLRSLKTASFDGKSWQDEGEGPGSAEGQYIDWLPIGDQVKSLWADVQRIRHHPLVPKEIPIYGYLYDVRTGMLNEVPEATFAGRVTP